MKMKLLLALLGAVVVGSLVTFVAVRHWVLRIPEQRVFEPPAKTLWKPIGARKAGRHDYSVIPEPTAFHTMHVGVDNTDELWTVVSPMVELDWVAEAEMYVPEGPTFDDAGNLYFSPYNPKEDVSLVSLEIATGKRRWTIPGRGAGNGATLVLNDPDRPGEQLIYHSTYAKGMALRQDGSRVWETPTGLVVGEASTPMANDTHVWGLNYHAPADAIVGVTLDGHVYAFDRRSGRALLREPTELPGSPAAITRLVPARIAAAGDAETDAVFGRNLDGKGLFTGITNVIFGNGFIVSNYFGIQPDNGRIYIAATAPDEQDGTRDGISENGAVFLLELSRDERGGDWRMDIVRDYAFSGGTGSTPTIRADGERVALSDDNGNVIALDADLNEVWRVNVGAQVAASIAVSSDNDEMYAVTKFDLTKIIDHGDRGEIVWKAQLDAYPGFDNFNALTPTIAANGVAISLGAGRQVRDQHIMHKVGVGLIDRETGQLRYFAEGREESISVTSIGPDGGFYLATSPVRRAATRGLLGEHVPPLTGGIQRFKPVRLDLLVRDAACAGADRIENTASIAASHPESAWVDMLQTRALMRQARVASSAAVEEGRLDVGVLGAIEEALSAAAASLDAQDFGAVADRLGEVCARFE